MPLNMHVVEPEITVVQLSGHLNLGNLLMDMEHKIKKVVEGGARKLAFDVAELNYIDSAGIGMLVSVNGVIGQAGGVMRIAGANGRVSQSFAVVHMEQIIPLDENLEISIAKFSSAQAAG